MGRMVLLPPHETHSVQTETAAWLRNGTGGKLKTSYFNFEPFPPLNVDLLSNANDAQVVPDDQLFKVGDVRGNENPGAHTLYPSLQNI
jgi:hypothetical protein